MKKLFTLMASTAMVAFGGIAVAGGGGDNDREGDKAKFDSEITLNYSAGPYDPYDPYYEESTFSGKVKATPANREARKRENGRAKCEKRRTVIIKNLDKPKPERTFATTKTNRDGRYSVEADNADPGTYRAKVLKKRKVRAEIKCFGARSNPVVVAGP